MKSGILFARVAAVVNVMFALIHSTDAAPPPPPPQPLCASIHDRIDCSAGLNTLNATTCALRGCCYAAAANVNSTVNECYYAIEGVPVRTIHVINSNHFDAGYADLRMKLKGVVR